MRTAARDFLPGFVIGVGVCLLLWDSISSAVDDLFRSLEERVS